MPHRRVVVLGSIGTLPAAEDDNSPDCGGHPSVLGVETGRHREPDRSHAEEFRTGSSARRRHKAIARTPSPRHASSPRPPDVNDALTRNESPARGSSQPEPRRAASRWRDGLRARRVRIFRAAGAVTIRNRVDQYGVAEPPSPAGRTVSSSQLQECRPRRATALSARRPSSNASSSAILSPRRRAGRARRDRASSSAAGKETKSSAGASRDQAAMRKGERSAGGGQDDPTEGNGRCPRFTPRQELRADHRAELGKHSPCKDGKLYSGPESDALGRRASHGH